MSLLKLILIGLVPSAFCLAKAPTLNISDKGVAVKKYTEACTFPQSDEELKKLLTPEQYEITKKNGTEAPFKNRYWNNHHPGLYVDIISGDPLFLSKDKFDSGTGWPSFTKPVEKDVVVEKKDKTLFMERVEIRSKRANSHLGHVFDDGPGPTGLRYCMNSASLRFIPLEKMAEAGYEKYLKHFNDADWKTAKESPFKE